MMALLVPAPRAGVALLRCAAGAIAAGALLLCPIAADAQPCPSVKLTAPDGHAGDFFGYCHAISGDTMVIGALQDDVDGKIDQGSAYVFVRSGSQWMFQQKLTPSDGAANDQFGCSSAISGDTLVIGAYMADVDAYNQGAVYVFTRSGTVWTQQAKLTHPSGRPHDNLGLQVAIEGDTVVAGAPCYYDRGAAYVFTRSGTTWTQEAKLTCPDGGYGAWFGYPVVLSGGTVAVGAPRGGSPGATYMFTRSGPSWIYTQKLTPPDGAGNDYFGESLSLSGDTLMVGSMNADVGGRTDQGAVYAFVRVGSTWTLQAKLTASDGAARDYFHTVGVSGNTAVVGAICADVGGKVDQGAAYTFVRTGTTWTEVKKLTAPDGAAYDMFGGRPSFFGNGVALHACYGDVDGKINQGAIYYFECNSRPIADAGLDQTVAEWDAVALDGSASHDPDTDPLSFTWSQIAGDPVALDLTDPVRPMFYAPEVPRDGATLTFQLTVDDGKATSDPDFVNVTVTNVNHVPVADAGDDQYVNEASVVTLDGTASYDPDDDPLDFEWAQVGGPGVMLSDLYSPMPTFTAPLVARDEVVVISFELSVSDGLDPVALDWVDITVENVNHAPIADAGPDASWDELTTVTLNGSATDPDSDPLLFWWEQTGGPAVALSDYYCLTPTFVAPLVEPSGATFTFKLTADDGLATTFDEVSLFIRNLYSPPVCSLARPSVEVLWPPNHKMIPVSILGVTNPEGGLVSISILGVTQDEPVDGLGDGDTAPDAVIQGGTVLLRSERAGSGNGRVYTISFRAVSIGGECTGSVTVRVPRDRRDASIDDGQFYNSLGQ